MMYIHIHICAGGVVLFGCIMCRDLGVLWCLSRGLLVYCVCDGIW